MVSAFALPALIAAAASLPTGLGFGAGYGAGVRLGYDVLYPALAPFARQFTGGILDAVKTVWDPSGVQDTVDIVKPPATDLPVNIPPTRGKPESFADVANPCPRIQEAARKVQKALIVAFNRSPASFPAGKLKGSSRISKQKQLKKALILSVSNQLKSITDDPSNASCVEGMKF